MKNAKTKILRILTSMISVVMTAAVLLSFCSCGGDDGSGEAEPEVTKQSRTDGAGNGADETSSSPSGTAAPAFGWYNLISDADEREIYDRVYGAVSHGEDSLTIDFNYYNDDSDAVRNTTLLCLYDHPEYICYDGSVEFEFSYGKDTGDGEMTISLGKNSFGDAEQREFDEEIAKITDGASALGSDYERALFVHDELAKRCVYDWDSAAAGEGKGDRAAHSAYGCAVNGSAVCEGYAKAYTAALGRLGIDCIYVPGEGAGESHAWNCVKLGDDYYFIDVTWDDADREEDYGVSVRYNYFGLTTAEAEKDHTPDDGIPPLPECTATEYNYYVYNGLVLDRYTREDAANLFNSGAASIKFTSEDELDAAVADLFEERGCYEIEAFNGASFAYSADGLVLNVYFAD